MREDTSKKNYVLKDTVEKLLYDFTLNKGDSFYFDAEYIPNTPPYKGWRKVNTTYFVNTLQGLRKVLVSEI